MNSKAMEFADLDRCESAGSFPFDGYRVSLSFEFYEVCIFFFLLKFIKYIYIELSFLSQKIQKIKI